MLTYSNKIQKHQKNKSIPFQGVIKYYTNIQNKNIKRLNLINITSQNISNLSSKTIKKEKNCNISTQKITNIQINNNLQVKSMDNIFFKFDSKKNFESNKKRKIKESFLKTFSPIYKNKNTLKKKNTIDKSYINHKKNMKIINKVKSISIEESIKNSDNSINKKNQTNKKNIKYKISVTENFENETKKIIYKPKIKITKNIKNNNLNVKKQEKINLKENKTTIKYNLKKKTERTKNIKQIKLKIPFFRNTTTQKNNIKKKSLNEKEKKIKEKKIENKKLENNNINNNKQIIKTEENKKSKKKVKIKDIIKKESESDESIIDDLYNSEDCLTKDLDEDLSFISKNKGTINDRYLIKKNPLLNKILNNNKKETLKLKNNEQHFKNHSLTFPIQISTKFKEDKKQFKLNQINRKNLNISQIYIRENNFNIEYSNETNDDDSTSYINNIDISCSSDENDIKINENKKEINYNNNTKKQIYEINCCGNKNNIIFNPINNIKLNNENHILKNNQINENNIYNNNNILKNSQKFFTYIPLFSKLIFPYCNLEILNTLTLINKKIYKSFLPIIYLKLKEKILLINKSKDKEIKTKIKKKSFKYSPLYKNIKFIEKIYYENLYNYKSSYDLIIKKDLPRTFPDNILFKEGTNFYNKLYRILSSYSNYNKKIGYAQGLNLITAQIILIFEKEEEIFLFLDSIVNRFCLESLIGINNYLLIKKLDKICTLIKNFCKKVSFYLENNNLSYEFFIANWVLTLFSNSMNIENLNLIWDFMIIFGWKFFYFFVISVINFYENDIISYNPDQISELKKNLLFSDKFIKNIENIINKTFHLMEINYNMID